MSSVHSSDWAWLPRDLLLSVFDKLVILVDHVHVAAVCKSWRSIVVDYITEPPSQLPLLLIPTKDNSREREGLYNVVTRKVLQFQLPMPYNVNRFCGSSHGWLATVDKRMAITLYNPFTGGTISLPPVEKDLPEFDEDECFEYNMPKVILSAEPSQHPDDYEVVAIFSSCRCLAIIKSGDEDWSYIDNKIVGIGDAIYHKGQLYAVYPPNGLIWVDLSNFRNKDLNLPPQANILIPRVFTLRIRVIYLVESLAGDLLMVQRCLVTKDDKIYQVTSKFKVFKLLNSNNLEWVEMECLGGDTLFLGDNHSTSVSASSFPGCQPNSIYYTDDCIDFGLPLPLGPRDMGIFNLQDGSIGEHYIPDPSQKHMPPPVWIVPMSRKSWV